MKSYQLVICGGGSTYTLPMIKTLCDFREVFPLRSIVLFDVDPDKQHMVYEAAKVMVEEAMGGVEVRECYTLDAAFADADFVFMQIRAGGLRMREQDEKIPLRHGCIGQETCGAGGFAYGMRSVPQVAEIVRAVRAQSPRAWIINYSNPAAIVAEATKRLFPGDRRLIHLCDMPIAIMDAFAESLGMKRQDLTPRYFGLNHFGWFTNLYDPRGKDLLPAIRTMLKSGSAAPEELKGDADWVETFAQLGEMVRDFDGEGYVPNTYLQYYLYPEKMAAHMDPRYTRANFVMDHRVAHVRQMCEYIVEHGSIRGSGLEKGVHGTYIVELASSIIRNENRTFIIITPNNGIIPNLPPEAMVEVPCLVNANGVTPLHMGNIPTFYKGLLENQYAYECLTVDALLNGDRDAALKALVLNRTVTDTGRAKGILEDLIRANRDYWQVK
ncbi:6-phospho-alpha-glucosidase [Candidatus Allofournierella merdavium]|uniref:family 4 glycosyl hydrolase n=1 Tax=Candidatus Allofournierella merdavium TaxID=2838593 RepID=UPI00374F3048